MVLIPCAARTYQKQPIKSFPGAPQSSIRVVQEKIAEKHNFKTDHTATRSNEKRMNVTVKFPMHGEEWVVDDPYVRVYNTTGFYEEFKIELTDENWEPLAVDHIDIELPEGTYDFLAMFAKVDPDRAYGLGPSIYNIRENITIAEGSIVEFKPEESIICLAMETVNPNGEKTKFRKIRRDADWNYEIIEEGNITDVFFDKIVLYDGSPISFITGNAGGVYVEPGPTGFKDPQEQCNFYVNDVSDRYLFQEVRMMPAWPNQNEGIYMAVTECVGSNEGIYTNNPVYWLDNSTVDNTIGAKAFPPIADEGDMARPYVYTFRTYSGGLLHNIQTNIEFPDPDIWKIYISGPEKVFDRDALYFGYKKSLYDIYESQEMPWGMLMINKAAIDTPYYFPFAEGGDRTSVYVYELLSHNPNASVYPVWPFPGNEAFGAKKTDIDIQAGASAPLLTLTNTKLTDWNSYPVSAFNEYYYTGRIGEYIGSTKRLSTQKLTVDGTEVAVGQDEIVAWMEDNPDVNGIYKIFAETDNFEIEGIRGGNKAEMTFNADGQDMTPPSATMLQFRDAEGKIAQIFDKPQDGGILISAGDFITNVGSPEDNDLGIETVWLNATAPKTVKASARATENTTDDFVEISLEEDPAGFDVRFGALYKGSLEDLKDLGSATGWFDLKIYVEDAAGNTQVQTISPAFKIMSQSGVASVSEDKDVHVSGNSIIAPEGSLIFSAEGIRYGNTDLAPGLYIVRTPTGTQKVLVR